jgi:hypothetical protein
MYHLLLLDSGGGVVFLVHGHISPRSGKFQHLLGSYALSSICLFGRI